MAVIDSQVHVWDVDGPHRPWVDASDEWIRVVPDMPFDMLVDVMDANGVDGAVLVSFKVYGWDNAYALAAAEARPDRFRVVGRIDPLRPDLGEAAQELAAREAVVGIRLLPMTPEEVALLENGGLEPVFSAAEAAGIAVCFFAHHHLEKVAAVAAAHPGLQVVIDHLGVSPFPEREGLPAFAGLDHVVDLARLPNVAIKLSGAPALAAEPFPYPDLWPRLHAVLDAYGVERVMWGSDWTRIPGVTYEESVRFIRDSDELSPDEKSAVLGDSLQRIMHWSTA